MKSKCQELIQKDWYLFSKLGSDKASCVRILGIRIMAWIIHSGIIALYSEDYHELKY